jgi:CP family cyanate transporter-like MFS transporter
VDAPRTGSYLLFVLGVFALALNLRPAVTSLPPIFIDLEHRIGLSAGQVTLLSAIPILSFGVFSVLSGPLTRRLGEERVLAIAMVGLVAGLVLRGLWPRILLYPGTVIATGAISLLNVLLSSLIKRRYPERAGFLLGIYLTALYVGSIGGSALAVPVLQHSDSVHLSLSMWALPALAGLVVWVPQLRRGRLAPPAVVHLPLYKSALSWQVAGFMGLQSLTYYATVSWLPTMLRERGSSATHAGYLTAALSIGGLVTPFAVPIVAHRRSDHRTLVAPSVAICMIATAGAFVAPLAAVPSFIVVLGFGQGAALALALYFFIARSPSPLAAASLSAMSQGFGYLLASTGPLIVGFVHSAVGNWTVPMLILLGFLLAEGVAGMLAARPLVLPMGVAVPAEAEAASH